MSTILIVVLRSFSAHGDDAGRFQYLQMMRDRGSRQMSLLSYLTDPNARKIAFQKHEQNELSRFIANGRKSILTRSKTFHDFLKPYSTFFCHGLLLSANSALTAVHAAQIAGTAKVSPDAFRLLSLTIVANKRVGYNIGKAIHYHCPQTPKKAAMLLHHGLFLLPYFIFTYAGFLS